MGLAYNTYLDSNRVYGCKGCKAHLANHDDIVSRVRTPSASLPLPLPSGRTLKSPNQHPNPNQTQNPH